MFRQRKPVKARKRLEDQDYPQLLQRRKFTLILVLRRLKFELSKRISKLNVLFACLQGYGIYSFRQILNGWGEGKALLPFKIDPNQKDFDAPKTEKTPFTKGGKTSLNKLFLSEIKNVPSWNSKISPSSDSWKKPLPQFCQSASFLTRENI